MRSSRLSHETRRVVNALSSSGRTPARRSQRHQTRDEAASRLNVEEGDDGQSDLSTAPSCPDDSEHESRAGSHLGKRKRNGLDGTTVARRSPRKAPKLEEEDGKASQRKPRRQPAKRITGPNGTLTVEPPPNWERVYDVTASMRKRVLAPVDTMGCESLAEETRSPRDQRLQTLVALMLSSQTKDTVTAVAMKNLQENLPGGFCLESLLKVEPEELNRLIEKVGFHNNKTKFIKSVALILRDQFKSDIPDSIEGLVSLPGVGPKMAYLCMSAAWQRDEGIGVDVHVHRITNLWAWHKTNTPEQTRAELEAWLPREKWHDINHLLVGFGQTICVPVGRKCGECDLAKENLCPSAVAAKTSPVKKRVKKEVEVKAEDGEVLHAQAVKVEEDDMGVRVEAEVDGNGKIELQTFSGNDAPIGA